MREHLRGRRPWRGVTVDYGARLRGAAHVRACARLERAHARTAPLGREPSVGRGRPTPSELGAVSRRACRWWGDAMTSRPARGQRVWEPAAGAPESQSESGGPGSRPAGGIGGRNGRGRHGRRGGTSPGGRGVGAASERPGQREQGNEWGKKWKN